MNKPQYLAAFKEAFHACGDFDLAQFLHSQTRKVAEIAYDTHLATRNPHESPPDHELFVLKTTLKIMSKSGCERASGLPFGTDDYLVGSLSAILHDTGEIRRVTQVNIDDALARGDTAEAETLRHFSVNGRTMHMLKSADATRTICTDNPGLVRPELAERVIDHIGLHDSAKLGLPYPPGRYWAPVCFVEADFLWPVSTEYPGPLADLQRNGILVPTPDQVKEQAKRNFDTQLKRYRASFPAAERFADNETFIRTTEGERILQEYRKYWRI